MNNHFSLIKSLGVCTLALILSLTAQNLYSQGSGIGCSGCGPGGTDTEIAVDGIELQNTNLKSFPSPTAAAFGKVQDIPIDLYNGTSRVSIPLHTISNGKIGVPLSLSYMSTGLRVQERSSRIGLGWNLMIGGAITRVMKGLPDDHFNGKGYLKKATELKNDLPDATSPMSKAEKDMLNEIVDNEYDSQPDKFILSTPTISGEFFYEGQGFVFESRQKANIQVFYSTANSNIIDYWEVTDMSGIKYTFEQAENSLTKIRSYSYTSSGGGSTPYITANHTSAWYLTRIEHPQTDNDIIIEYSGTASNFLATINESVLIYGDVVILGNPLCNSIEDTFIENEVTSSRSTPLPTKITFENDANSYVEFVWASRDDITSEKRLSEMKVYQHSNLIKKFDFTHGYFGTGTNKRLRLDEVTEKNATGNELPPHVFTYFAGYSFPEYTSKNIDHWGYYNGPVGNTTFVPTTIYNGSTIYTGANRTPDANYSKLGMLTQIDYPTGGFVNFYYEGNNYSYIGSDPGLSADVSAGGVRVKKIAYYDTPGVASKIKTYDYTRYGTSSLSSGKIYNNPTFITDDGHSVFYDGANNITCDNFHIGSSAALQIGDFTWNQFGYGVVTEKYSSTNEYGETIHLFEKHPYKDEGKLNIKEVENSAGIELSKLDNDYTYSYTSKWAQNATPSRKIDTYTYGCGSGCTYTVEDTTWETNGNSQWEHLSYLSSTTEQFYNGAGTSNYIQKTKNYTVDPSTMLPLTITETVEGYPTKKTTYEYFVNGANYIHNYPKKTSVTQGVDTLSSVEIVYDNNSSFSSKYQLDKQKVLRDGSYVTVFDAVSYDDYGNLLEAKDALGESTKFFYGSNGAPFTQNGEHGVNGVYLTGIQKVLDGTGCANNDLCSEAEYNNLGQLTSMIDENGNVQTYSYDSFGRLKTQENQNGFVANEFDYVYSSDLNSGVYDSDEPNKVVSTTIINGPGFIDLSFAAITTWDDVTENFSFNGERTMRVGFNGGTWDGFAEYTTFTKGIAKADFYIGPDVTSGSAIIFYIRSSDGNDIFALRYNASPSAFRAWSKKNGSWGSQVSIGVTAEKGKWYTVEFVRGDNQTQADMFVYPKGEQRNYSTKHTETGFPSDWTTHVQSSGGLSGGSNDYYYVANISAGERIQAVTYADGLGREIQSQSRGGNSVITTETLYDGRSMPEVVSRPIERTPEQLPGFFSDGLISGGQTFSPGDVMHQDSPVHAYYKDITATNEEDYAYSQTQYEASPLARVEKATIPGVSYKMGSNKEVVTTYGLNGTETFSINTKTWGINSLSKTITEDPSGKKTISYTDGYGQVIASGVDMNGDNILSRATGGDLVTEFEYDLSGNLVRVEDPRDLITTYTYNSLNQLTEKSLPDQDHPNKYCYDDKGRLRFHAQPNDIADPYYYYSTPHYNYTYTRYDELDRPIEVGQQDGFSSTNSTETSFNLACASTTTRNTQSEPNTLVFPQIHYSYDGNDAAGGAQNLEGRLTRTYYKDPHTGTWGYTWYSYNALGLVEWVKQRLPNQTSSYNDRTLTYTYDDIGRLTKLTYDEGYSSTNDHFFWYYYDELGRLEKVSSYGSNNEGSALTEAEYSYYADGQIKQLKLGGSAQTIDYEYTVQGWMDEINNGTASGTDVFGMALEYADNGNIDEQHWVQSAFSTSTASYFYDYDNANRLIEACYGSATCSSTGDYDVTYEYDKNGNLDKINRNGAGSEPDLEFTALITSGTNKVNYYSVDGISGATSAESKYFDYDANGNVTKNEVQGIANDDMGITAASYDWRNLPLSTTTSSGLLQFAYDADGNRIKKKLVGGATTWYVRDANGQTFAAYDDSGNMVFMNILAGGQIIGQIDN